MTSEYKQIRGRESQQNSVVPKRATRGNQHVTKTLGKSPPKVFDVLGLLTVRNPEGHFGL